MNVVGTARSAPMSCLRDSGSLTLANHCSLSLKSSVYSTVSPDDFWKSATKPSAMYNGQFDIRNVPVAGPLSWVVVVCADWPLSEPHAARKDHDDPRQRSGRRHVAD